MRYSQMIQKRYKSAEDTQKIVCSKCHKIISYGPANVSTHYHLGYDSKTVQCPYCKRFNIIGYTEQYGFDVNKDVRFYTYKK